MDRCTEIERSLIKKFRKSVWNRFIEAVQSYELIKQGDKIAVCISGGKDSFILAKLMQELQRHGHTNFDLEFICMDPGYSPQNRLKIEQNCALMQIPVKIFESDIFAAVENIEQSPCYLCARMRRGHLYSFAKDLGCNKIALGHHFNDAIETALMGMLYSGQFQTMMPKLHSTNFKGMELIRPLYCVREDDIKAFARYNNLEFLNCACRFTEKLGESGAIDREGISKRYKCKELIKVLKKEDDLIDINIFRSFHRVNLDTIIGYHKKGDEHSFLDDYEKE
ncbi:MAG: tRNA 2-thiocytidine biosynthesis protein TtcA [Clostridia bacterium]|nr:tRNA 2-thiocytidine biosynthesis protein TtcA [Clostridia bacterium]